MDEFDSDWRLNRNKNIPEFTKDGKRISFEKCKIYLQLQNLWGCYSEEELKVKYQE